MWLQRKKHKGPKCQFFEEYSGSYLRYRSVVNDSMGVRYLGFNKLGKPMKNPHGRQECFNFIKYNPNSDIGKHNNIVTMNMGARETRHPSNVHMRKPSSSLRATKNSLQVDSSTRKMVSTHRHRHSNRWKLREDDSTLRRRHGSRFYLGSNNYWAVLRLVDQDCLIGESLRPTAMVGISGTHRLNSSPVGVAPARKV